MHAIVSTDCNNSHICVAIDVIKHKPDSLKEPDLAKLESMQACIILALGDLSFLGGQLTSMYNFYKAGGSSYLVWYINQ